MVRTGVRTFLELQQDMEVVGEASSGEHALALVAAMDTNIVLLDLVLPGLSGLETARRLRDTRPDVKVVVLTSFSGQDSVLPAVRAGVAVLRLIGRGLSNRLIARELVLSEKTVKAHVSAILSKLGVADRTQAALLAVRDGLVDS